VLIPAQRSEFVDKWRDARIFDTTSQIQWIQEQQGCSGYGSVGGCSVPRGENMYIVILHYLDTSDENVVSCKPKTSVL
jgi:hypothetical protein